MDKSDDKSARLRRCERLLLAASIGSAVGTFGTFFLLARFLPLLVAYGGGALVVFPCLLAAARLQSRYDDLQFRDDL